MPITNIVIILFILAMVYMGTVQGLFSSFLHLMVVIAAGTLAFAVWEPLTLSLLLKYVPILAWTLGLLVPFGLLLLILRMTSDKLVPANAQFPGIADLLLGGGCGALSGVLTAGIAVIGIGFLPFGPDMGGFQPYSVGNGGTIQSTGSKLWVPVNSIAANFYGALSRGAFSTKTPLADYKPDLEVQMSLIRVRPDGVSIVAAPDAVNVTGAYIADVANLTDASLDIAEALGPQFKQPGTQLVIVETEWSTVKNTVDSDRALRLPSSHARLITKSTESGSKKVELAGPIGFTKPIGDNRVFYSFNAESQMGFSTAPTSTFAWVYLVPPGQKPLFPQVRFLRLDMPDDSEIVRNPQEVLAALGSPEAPQAEDEDDDQPELTDTTQNSGGTVGDRTGIRAGTQVLEYPQITNKLPITASKNTTGGLTIGDDSDGAVIESGTGSARKPPGSIGKNNKIVGFRVYDHQVMVRIKITGDQNRSIFAAGMSSAAALNLIYLEDTQGNKWQISAWVWMKESKDQEIHFDSFDLIRSANQMPISKMGDNDEFYIYFTVTKPATLTRYCIGDANAQDFEPPLVVK